MKTERKNSEEREKGKKIRLIKNKFTLSEDFLARKYEFRRNLLSLEIEIREKGEKEWASVNENSLFRELQGTGHGIALNVVVSLLRSDFVDDYDPIDTYFNNIKYDGKSHISELAKYVKANDQPQWELHLKKHLVRTVKCALDSSYFNKQALILVHDKQNSGKSSFIRFLCPPQLAEYIAEDVSTDKDSRILLVKNFIINLDELDKLNKKEIAAVKSFISKVQINERLPYDRKNSVLSRRASFFGSTNNYELLDDPTGSVRWICFEITGIDWAYSQKIEIDKVWAEAHHLYVSGFECDLTKDEIKENEERNKRFQILSMELQLIDKHFIPDTEELLENFKTATEILEILVKKSHVGSKLNVVQVGKALNVLGYPRGKKTHDRINGYYAKEKINE